MRTCTAVLTIEGRKFRCTEPADGHKRHEAGTWFRDGLWVRVSWGLADPPKRKRIRKTAAD